MPVSEDYKKLMNENKFHIGNGKEVDGERKEIVLILELLIKNIKEIKEINDNNKIIKEELYILKNAMNI